MVAIKEGLFFRCVLFWLLMLGMLPAVIGAEPSTYPNQYGNNFAKGKAFFERSVIPRLIENGCLKCHARGYLRPNVIVYDELIRHLVIDDSAENNAVIHKLGNIRSISPEMPNHPGGSVVQTLK